MGLGNSPLVARHPRAHDKPDFSLVPTRAGGCVVVFHEVWGLVEHTKDVCKRVSKLGFAATAPNLYAGYDDVLTPSNIQRAMEGVWKLTLEERRDKDKVARTLAKKGVGERTKEVVAILYDQGFRDKLLERAVSAVDGASSKFKGVSTLGFCLGGGLSMKTATKGRRLSSAISFYGEPPPSSDVRYITSPILAIYASKDDIINSKVPAFVEAMIGGGKDLTLKTYPNTLHGFFNDARKAVYNRRAAAEAWDITAWFLERTLGKL